MCVLNVPSSNTNICCSWRITRPKIEHMMFALGGDHVIITLPRWAHSPLRHRGGCWYTDLLLNLLLL